jgi:hypothetical protein
MMYERGGSRLVSEPMRRGTTTPFASAENCWTFMVNAVCGSAEMHCAEVVPQSETRVFTGVFVH